MAVIVAMLFSGGAAFAIGISGDAEILPGSTGIQKAVDAGATPEQAVAQILKKTLMCPSIVGCAEIVTAAISLYPEQSRNIVSAAVIAAPACEREICQGAILAGMDPLLCGQATAAGRRPPAQFQSVGLPDLCPNCGGVASPS